MLTFCFKSLDSGRGWFRAWNAEITPFLRCQPLQVWVSLIAINSVVFSNSHDNCWLLLSPENWFHSENNLKIILCYTLRSYYSSVRSDPFSNTCNLAVRNVVSRQRRHFTSFVYSHGSCWVFFFFKAILLFLYLRLRVSSFIWNFWRWFFFFSRTTHLSLNQKSNYFLRIPSSAFGSSQLGKVLCLSLERGVC